jgi:hypothetical protein
MRWWIAAFISIVGLLSVVTFSRNRRFDAAVWRAASVPKSIRLRMVGDLLESRQLIGMSQLEIDHLLGRPELNRTSSNEYVYYLGPERSFMSIDDEWLSVKFENGRAAAVVVHPD